MIKYEANTPEEKDRLEGILDNLLYNYVVGYDGTIVVKQSKELADRVELIPATPDSSVCAVYEHPNDNSTSFSALRLTAKNNGALPRREKAKVIMANPFYVVLELGNNSYAIAYKKLDECKIGKP